MSKGKKRFITTLSVVIMAIMVVATFCHEPVEAKTKVALSKKSVTVSQGKTTTVKVTGTKKKVAWKSSNTKVAVVSSKGVVKGVKKGSATITAKVSGKTYKCTVKVEAPTLSSKLVLTKGRTSKLKVAGTTRAVKWSTSNTKIATIKSNGTITPKAKGTVKVYAKLNDKTFVSVAKIESPSISKKSIVMSTGVKYKLAVLNSARKAKWSTSNSKIAVVDKNGVVTTKAAGTAKIFAKLNDVTYTCTVKVENPKLNTTSTSLLIGNKSKLTVSGSTRKVVWSSSNTKIVKVDQKGNLSAVAQGTAYVYAKVNDKTLKCKVVVNTPLAGLPNSITVNLYEETVVTFKAYKEFTVTSLDSKRVFVEGSMYNHGSDANKKVYVTGKTPSNAYILFKTNDGKYSKKVLVKTVAKEIKIEYPAYENGFQIVSAKAYRFYYKGEPKIHIVGSIKSNQEFPVSQIFYRYECYDKNGKEIKVDSFQQLWFDTAKVGKKGGSDWNYLSSQGKQEIENITTVKLVDLNINRGWNVEYQFDKSVIKGTYEDDAVRVSSTSFKYKTSNADGLKPIVSFSITNKTSKDLYVKVTYKYYDRDNNLLGELKLHNIYGNEGYWIDKNTTEHFDDYTNYRYMLKCGAYDATVDHVEMSVSWES